MKTADGSAGRGRLIVVALLAAAVGAPLVVPWHVEPGQAWGYGRHHYHYGYGRYIAKCQRGCAKYTAGIHGCGQRFLAQQKQQCHAAFHAMLANCAGSCRRTAKTALRMCQAEAAHELHQDARQAKPGRCNHCCQKTKGTGSCLDYLSNSRFYGSARYHGHLNCTDSYGGSASAAFVGGFTDTVRAWIGGLFPSWARLWDR